MPLLKPFLLTLCALLCVYKVAYAQIQLSGSIYDRETGEALAFASVVYDPVHRRGTTSDLNGRFSLLIPTGTDTLVVSYIGYQRLRVLTDTLDLRQPLTFYLDPLGVQVGEVLIEAEKNPAEKIIRRVIAQKPLNDPEKLPSYTCSVYTQTHFDWLLPDSIAPNDSFSLRIRDVSARQGIFIMETVIQRRFLRPGRAEETVTANRVSGFKNPAFAILSTDFQPFSFYNESITLVDRTFLNPIARSAPQRYAYQLKDTLFQETDTLYIIQYGPASGSPADLLQGMLYISTQGYAIQQVTARPAEAGLIDLNIQQMYARAIDNQWFPQQLLVSVSLRDYPSKGLGMQISSKSFVRDVQTDVPLRPSDLALEEVRFADNAARNDTAFWRLQRQQVLSWRDQNTYRYMDSLGSENHLDQKLKLIDKLTEGRLQLGPVDLDVNRLWVFNGYEGNRVGLGAKTNENISRHFSAGLWVGYGFRDRAWKYGGDLTAFFDKHKDWSLGIAAFRDVEDPGRSALDAQQGLTNLRSYSISRMDQTEQVALRFSLRAFRYATASLSLQRTLRDASGYGYGWNPGFGEVLSQFQTTEFQAIVRYAWREKFISTLGRRISAGSRYPVLTFVYTQGLPWFSGSLRYRKVELWAEQQFRTTRTGVSRIYLRSGKVFGQAPASLLFYGPGVRVENQTFFVSGLFQTMRPYEFLSDQYASLIWVQDLGRIKLKTPLSRPEFRLAQGVFVGSLRNPEAHEGITFVPANKGYYETGILADHLLRYRYVNVLWLGLGGGVSYRYGPYHQPSLISNFAWSITLSFRSV